MPPTNLHSNVIPDYDPVSNASHSDAGGPESHKLFTFDGLRSLKDSPDFRDHQILVDQIKISFLLLEEKMSKYETDEVNCYQVEK